ncbi:MAG TPA: hypothetical protein VLU99_06160, partial [Nitrososphaerales archaeon]|nr:hypothetical protein [Nitrososphaerales archaeon]
MKVLESIRGAMDAFDAFYDSTSRQETGDARKRAISAIVKSKADWSTPMGREAIADKIIELVVNSGQETRAMTGPEVADMILGVLGTGPHEVDSAMRHNILTARLERLVGEAADGARLLPARQTEEWGSHDMVYAREIDGWEVTLGYFPEYLRPRVVYGQVGISPQISKSMAMSVRYHVTKHHLVSKEGNGDGESGLLKFMKSKELDKLA